MPQTCFFFVLSYFSEAGEFSLSFKKCKSSIWRTTERANEHGVGIWQRLRQQIGRKRRRYSAWWLMRRGCLREILIAAAKVANQQASEQDTLSSAWRALVLPSCQGRVFPGNSWNHLCGRPKDEPGLDTVGGSLSGIPADLAWTEKEKRGNQFAAFNSPRWRQPSTCGVFVSVALSIISSWGLKLQIRGKSGSKSTWTTLVIIGPTQFSILAFAFAGNQLVSVAFQGGLG